jgi:hypothetical protein
MVEKIRDLVRFLRKYALIILSVVKISAGVAVAASDLAFDFASLELPQFPSIELCLSHTEGKGLGYSQGYSSLDLILCEPFWDSQCASLVDLRGHIFNHGKRAANAGLGLRWMDFCHRCVWGINGFYDYYRPSHHPYSQVSLGIEALGSLWEFRMNGYFPYRHVKTSLYEFQEAKCLGIRRAELAMKGIDCEIGYRFCNACWNLYLGFGPYVYWGRSGKAKNAFPHRNMYAAGGRISAHAFLFNYFTLDGSASYDSRFKWCGQAKVGIDIPFELFFGIFNWPPSNGSCCLADKLYAPILRNEVIVSQVLCQVRFGR